MINKLYKLSTESILTCVCIVTSFFAFHFVSNRETGGYIVIKLLGDFCCPHLLSTYRLSSLDFGPRRIFQL